MTTHPMILRAFAATIACCVLSGGAASPDKKFRTALEQSREGYRTAEDFPKRGQIITTRAVEVLGGGELQARVHHLEVQAVTRSAVILRDKPVDRSIVPTGVSICFDRPTVPAKDTTFLVLSPILLR